MTQLIFADNVTIFTNLKGQIFVDFISGIFCVALFFNRNKNKASELLIYFDVRVIYICTTRFKNLI